MKLHFEIDADGYSDIINDMGKTLNMIIDNMPSLMIKAKALKDFVENMAREEADKRRKDCSVFTEEAPAEHAAPAEEAPAEIKKDKKK